jgi:hypothetical protein
LLRKRNSGGKRAEPQIKKRFRGKDDEAKADFIYHITIVNLSRDNSEYRFCQSNESG